MLLGKKKKKREKLLWSNKESNICKPQISEAPPKTMHELL
jgi:hypothetical protein